MKDTQQEILRRIDGFAPDIIAFAQDIYRHAEPGYREFRTAEKVAEIFRKAKLETEEHIAVTGVRAVLGPGGRHKIAIVGELDGIGCLSHPFANPDNGMSHACGHHMQLAALIGAALALSDPEIAGEMDGTVEFLAIPAEEYMEQDMIARLESSGQVKYGGSGKSEFIYRGLLDGVEAALTHHAHYFAANQDALLGSNSTNGFISKTVRITGRAAHAGGAPWDGVNALSAAAIGLNALAFARETFRDEDHVRVHPILRKGGEVVNAVPEKAELEMMVRAKSLAAMKDASEKTDRAFRAGAMAMGAQIEITDHAGCLPLQPALPPAALTEAAALLGPSVSWAPVNLATHNSISTDAGDLSHLMPVVNFTTGGFSGGLHQADFTVTDPYKAYILPVKLMALTAYNLLKDGGAGIRDVASSFHPLLTKQEYLYYADGKGL